MRRTTTFLLVLLLSAPAVADWLVTRDGERVRTDGPWEVRGRQVVFTAPGGTLSALRLDEVDLDASERATEEAKRPPAPPAEPAPPREAILVLTDDDFGHVDPSTIIIPGSVEEEEAAVAEAAAEAAGREADEMPAIGRVEVSDWSGDDAVEDHVAIQGALRNVGGTLAVEIRLVVTLRDANGDVVGEAPAQLAASTLNPEASTRFRADFPDVAFYSSASFQVTHDAIDPPVAHTVVEPAPPEDEEEPAG